MNAYSLPGSRLNFYEPGTTLPVDIFNDRLFKTAHTNPVIADADGRFPEIFLERRDHWIVFENADGVYIASFVFRGNS